MKITQKEDQEKLTLRIQGPFVISHAGAIREEIISCFKTDKNIELDLNDVTDCDISGLQILWAAFRAARKTMKSFHVKNTPQLILDKIKITGIDPNTLLSWDSSGL